MAFQKDNKIPTGVGKKILEALKTSKDIDEDNNTLYNNHEENEYIDYSYNTGNNYNHTINPPNFKEYTNNLRQSEQVVFNENCNADTSNINTLVDLVSKLPPGVTKHTGAQIIKHTMEAMGISMNKVLANAQHAQDDFEMCVKSNVSAIEEYKMKIKILEQEIQQYKKQARDLEDIINLFIISDKK